MKRKKQTLIVFGTLCKGNFNHDFFMKSAKFISTATIQTNTKKYLLSPMMNRITDDLCIGEIYKVSDKDFEKIKKFESGFGYKIKEIDVAADDGYIYKCKIFVIPKK